MARKITAAAIASVLILALLLSSTGGEASDSECSAVSRSRTFEGDCESKRPCADACRREGYLDGYCFTDVAGPDHRVCMCTKQCMPARQPQLSS